MSHKSYFSLSYPLLVYKCPTRGAESSSVSHASHVSQGKAGVGMFCVFEKGSIVVRQVLDGMSAQLSGRVSKDDVIFSVDGCDVDGMTLDTVRGMLVGDEGTYVTVGFLRKMPGGGSERFTVDLLRGSADFSVLRDRIKVMGCLAVLIAISFSQLKMQSLGVKSLRRRQRTPDRKRLRS